MATSQSLTAQLIDGTVCNWSPIDHNLQSWAFDPAHANSTYTLATGGTVYVVAVKMNPRVITNVVAAVTTAGSVLTSGQCFAGVYQNGALLGSTADQSGVWNSTGLKTMPLASPVQVTQGGLVYVALVFNGTTGPTLSAGIGTGMTEQGVNNAGLLAASARFGTANTSVTTALPASLATVAALNFTPWVALS